MKQTVGAVVIAVSVVLAVAFTAGCRDDGWHPEAPFAPSLRPAFGARVTDGQLRIWTGSLCRNASRISVYFAPSRSELVLTSEASVGAAIEYLTIGGEYRGFRIGEPLPGNFEWRREKQATLSVGGATPSGNGWGSTTELSSVIKESPQHPDDTYWFQDVGWLNPAEVAAKDGKDFLATCTPDPAKKKPAPS